MKAFVLVFLVTSLFPVCLRAAAVLQAPTSTQTHWQLSEECYGQATAKGVRKAAWKPFFHPNAVHKPREYSAVADSNLFQDGSIEGIVGIALWLTTIGLWFNVSFWGGIVILLFSLIGVALGSYGLFKAISRKSRRGGILSGISILLNLGLLAVLFWQLFG